MRERILCEDSIILREWLNNQVPRARYNEVKEKMVRACAVNSDKFNNCLYGKIRMPEHMKRDVNKVAVELTGKEIFQLATPEHSPEA